MGLGKLLHRHEEHADAGGTIDRPRTYEALGSIAFLGGRRAAFTRVAAAARPRAGDRVLDVGCGTGYLSRILSPVVTPSGHVTGLDPSPAMVEYATRHAPANCTYVVGEGQRLPFPDASFDLVVSSLAVHHMPAGARPEALRQMCRVLRPGGRLLIAEFRPPANPLARHLVGALSGPAMRHDPRDLLGTLIPDAGFQVESEGDLPYLLYYVRATRP
ncbi:methyltransferase domain-containing protein [Nonomuraea phyllanthi]|uniref:Methyltransferase domain-containing protein n=1 Tax=Nonomuraea phyllanthi TaxID=2219224 RepID=A0A5C4W4I1_9ACTN|nr:class I SAM-dependent methyltransferase [Nonomuraea phyllanthi]KAB8191818.1 methyltransferase domain-containing protein [Nonomuraea phyllanthi]QFY10099.1 methyltransferase domain-containing protein [Nonomuraea phyllanthi]